MGYVYPSDDYYCVKPDALTSVMQANPQGPDQVTDIDLQQLALKDILALKTVRNLSVAMLRSEYMYCYNAQKDVIYQTSKKKPTTPKDIPLYSVAFLMCLKNIVRCINLTRDPSKSTKGCVLGIYDETDGLYHIDEEYIRDRAYQFRSDINGGKNFEELMKNLKSIAMIVQRSQYNPKMSEWVPCENLIFDFKTKKTYDYSPEYIFLNKLVTPYDSMATSPIFNMDTCQIDPNATTDMVDLVQYWQFDPWLYNLMSDTAEDADAIMYSISRAIRPSTGMQAILYYSRAGSSGKSTLLNIIRILIGGQNIIWKNVESMAGKFDLANLTYASAIMADENKTNKYLDQLDMLKAIITHNTVAVRDLYKSFVDVDPCVSVVQAFNALPKVADGSGSFFRRIWMMEFKKHFFGDDDNRDIQNIYTQHEEVLKYILKTALELPFFTYLPQTATTENCMEMIREINDSWAQSFIDEVMDEELKCKVYPAKCLYVIYKTWLQAEKPNNRPVSEKMFRIELSQALEDNPNSHWYFDKNKELNSKSKAIEELEKMQTFDIIVRLNIREFHNFYSPGYGNLLVSGDLVKTRYKGCFIPKCASNGCNE